MSNLNIASHLKKKRNETDRKQVRKRTHKDYSMSFKLSVVREYESENYGLGYFKFKTAYKVIPH